MTSAMRMRKPKLVEAGFWITTLLLGVLVAVSLESVVHRAIHYREQRQAALAFKALAVKCSSTGQVGDDDKAVCDWVNGPHGR